MIYWILLTHIQKVLLVLMIIIIVIGLIFLSYQIGYVMGINHSLRVAMGGK